METNVNISRKKDKRAWVHIGIILGVVAVVLVGLIVGTVMFSRGGSQSAPVMLREQCAYEMYEIRSDTVRLTYRITLQNNTGTDLVNFAMRGVLREDYKSGYLLDDKASVEQWGTHSKLFTLKDGETQTFDLVLIAPYYRNDEKASGTLPQLYAVYPDGSEGLIKIQ